MFKKCSLLLALFAASPIAACCSSAATQVVEHDQPLRDIELELKAWSAAKQVIKLETINTLRSAFEGLDASEMLAVLNGEQRMASIDLQMIDYECRSVEDMLDHKFTLAKKGELTAWKQATQKVLKNYQNNPALAQKAQALSTKVQQLYKRAIATASKREKLPVPGNPAAEQPAQQPQEAPQSAVEKRDSLKPQGQFAQRTPSASPRRLTALSRQGKLVAPTAAVEDAAQPRVRTQSLTSSNKAQGSAERGKPGTGTATLHRKE